MGVPLLCWNHITFKRIAEVWGSIVALGENANQTLGCEKLSLLISTNQMHKINEVIELEVGKELFEVSVSETVLLDAASNSDRREWLVSEGGDSSKSGEAINVDCLGMCSHDYTAVQENVETRFIGEQDLLGSRIEVPPVEPASDQISTPKVSDNGLDQTSNLEVLNGGSDLAVILFNGLSEPSFIGLDNVVLDLEDPCSTELVDVPSLLGPQVNAFNQKDLQDIALNSEMAVDPLPVGLSDPKVGGSMLVFPEFQSYSKPGRGKRYGSLKTLQLVYFIYLRLE
ncbi:hypothetical protein V6N13_113354 [Hibiscus sabdariffa]